jgi:hypothetical protein
LVGSELIAAALQDALGKKSVEPLALPTNVTRQQQDLRKLNRSASSGLASHKK